MDAASMGVVMMVDELRNEMRTEFNSLRAEIRADGETTRRRFDVFVEELKDIVKVVTDATVRHTRPSTLTRVD